MSSPPFAHPDTLAHLHDHGFALLPAEALAAQAGTSLDALHTLDAGWADLHDYYLKYSCLRLSGKR